MNRRTFLTTTTAAAVTSLAGCAGLLGSQSAEGDWDVGMRPNAFTPETLEVTVGTTVLWRNTDSRRHTITAYENGIPADAEYFASGGFESEAAARDSWRTGFGGNIESGGEYKHTFDVPGTYQYFCIPHESTQMVGTVRVLEE